MSSVSGGGFVEGIVEAAKREIKERLKCEAEKISAEVIARMMNGIKITTTHYPEHRETNFTFTLDIREGGG